MSPIDIDAIVAEALATTPTPAAAPKPPPSAEPFGAYPATVAALTPDQRRTVEADLVHELERKGWRKRDAIEHARDDNNLGPTLDRLRRARDAAIARVTAEQSTSDLADRIVAAAR